MFSKGRNTDFTDITSKVSEAQLLKYYLGVDKIPSVINSPLRRDNHPSFGLFTDDNIHIGYTDFSTRESGGTITLLKKYLHLNDDKLREKILSDLPYINRLTSSVTRTVVRGSSNSQEPSTVQLSCHIREWRQYDIDYWGSYGVTLEWLKWCEVYPIDYKFITKNGRRYTFKADKYAYAFVERKENKITYKFYQPFNKNGFKWQNSHDRSVLGLWTKLPDKGESMCICSSVKDALCLMSNLRIPCICVQGEGYPISNTALNVLRDRFTDIYICLDNDETGLVDAQRDTDEYGFINVVIPPFEGGKDISDFYKVTNNKEKFIDFFKKLFNDAREAYYDELPF